MVRVFIEQQQPLQLRVNCGHGDVPLRVTHTGGVELKLAAPVDVPVHCLAVGVRGGPGPQGEQGIPGPPGSGSAMYTFASASQLWVINHNLGRMPAIEIYTTGGVNLFGMITHVSVNQATVNLESALAGFAIVT